MKPWDAKLLSRVSDLHRCGKSLFDGYDKILAPVLTPETTPMSETESSGANPQPLHSVSSIQLSKPFGDHLEGLLVDAAIELRRIAAGETVFTEGDRGDSAYFIRAGCVDILGRGPDGKERLLHRLGKGELFGEMALLDRTLRSASALTREESELFVITRDQIVSLLAKEPQITLWMIGLTSHRLRVLTRTMSQMEQVHEVNRRILVGQEEERRRIGRDMHDGVAQSFANSILRLQSALQLLDRDPGRARSALEDLEKGLRDSLEEIRELIRSLFSRELRIAGLVEAINQFLDRVAKSEILDISFEHRGLEDELPAALEETLFGIVQEALSNVRKHAKASEVWIDLRRNDQNVSLLVKDNGCGFDLGKLLIDPAKQNTYGLLSMQERADLAGGTMDIDSRPGAGTRLRFLLPVRAPSTRGLP